MEGLVARVVDHPIREQFKRTRKWKRRSSTRQNASASALRRCHLKTGKKNRALLIRDYESISQNIMSSWTTQGKKKIVTFPPHHSWCK